MGSSKKNTEMQPTFQEQQRFTQVWIWVTLLIITLIPFYGIFQQVILGRPFGENPMPDTGLFIFALLMLVFLWYFRQVRLETEIDEQEIRMRFWPFSEIVTPWAEVETVRLVKFRFISRGIRTGTAHGTAYCVAGDRGLAVTLKSGRKYMIGTQRPEEMRRFLQERLDLALEPAR